MEELKGLSTIKGYPQSGPPIQRLMIVCRMEMALQSTMGHALKYEEPMVLVGTIAK